jgi:hypothetical protein
MLEDVRDGDGGNSWTSIWQDTDRASVLWFANTYWNAVSHKQSIEMQV